MHHLNSDCIGRTNFHSTDNSIISIEFDRILARQSDLEHRPQSRLNLEFLDELRLVSET